MEKPPTYNADLADLPKALHPLTRESRWVCWVWKPRPDKDGKKTWTKPPRQARDPRLLAKSDDPRTWSTYQRAVRQWKAGEVDGIGFMLGDSETGPSTIGALDLDKCCRRKGGKIKT